MPSVRSAVTSCIRPGRNAPSPPPPLHQLRPGRPSPARAARVARGGARETRQLRLGAAREAPRAEVARVVADAVALALVAKPNLPLADQREPVLLHVTVV